MIHADRFGSIGCRQSLYEVRYVLQMVVTALRPSKTSTLEQRERERERERGRERERVGISRVRVQDLDNLGAALNGFLTGFIRLGSGFTGFYRVSSRVEEIHRADTVEE